MNSANFLANLFPKQSRIPAEYDLHGPVNQTEYLIDGELRQWSGATFEALNFPLPK